MQSRPKQQLFIRGQWGLGDNIYARPFVKELANKYELFLDTPWPEIYEDLEVKFILRPRKLRTQMKNVARQKPNRWSQMPRLYVNERQIGYGAGELPRLNIPAVLAQRFGVKTDWANWDLPHFAAGPIVHTDKPVAVIKATTVRTEWKSQSRNPLPGYVNWIGAELMATHTVVAVGDVDGSAETLVGNPPPAHVKFLRGELDVEQLITLIRQADIIVGGVGWNVPMSIALKVKSFCVLGGRGGHNAPEVITDSAMDLSRIGFATPAKYCRCSNAHHNCNKDIPDLAAQWRIFCAKVGLPSRSAISPGIPPASVSIPSPPAPRPMIEPISIGLSANPEL